MYTQWYSYALYLVLWIVLNCAPMWICRCLHSKYAYNEERDKNFKPFTRIDFNKWNFFSTIITHFFFWPRFIANWTIVLSVAVLASIVMCGHKKGTPVHKVRYFIVARMISWGGRACLLCWGFLWIKQERVATDYSKWLGPDYEKTYKNAGTLVCNHQTFSDILVQLWCIKPAPGFLAKKEIRDIPGLGYLAESLQCLFVSRSKTAETAETSKARVL